MLTVYVVISCALIGGPMIAWYMGKEKGRREAANEAESWTQGPDLIPFETETIEEQDRRRYRGRHRQPFHWFPIPRRVATA